MTSPHVAGRSKASPNVTAATTAAVPRTTIGSILIPFDGEATESAARYVRHGAQLARLLRAKVTLMHVTEPIAPEDYEDEEHRAAAEVLKKKDTEKAVRRVKQIADACQITNHVVQTEGRAAERILSTSCDLIVMGAHSRKPEECHTVGTVVQSVLRESSVPVLALRSPSDAASSSSSSSSSSTTTTAAGETISAGSPTGVPKSPSGANAIASTLPNCDYRKIFIGYDGTVLGDNAILKAAPLARAMRSEVTLVYVLDQTMYPDEAQRRRQIEQAEAFLRRGKAVADQEGLTNCRTLLEIAPRHIADHLVHLANAKACDLLVVGTHGRRGVDRRLLGSVAEGLLRMATRPVLIVTHNALRKDNGDSLTTAYAALRVAGA